MSILLILYTPRRVVQYTCTVTDREPKVSMRLFCLTVSLTYGSYGRLDGP